MPKFSTFSTVFSTICGRKVNILIVVAAWAVKAFFMLTIHKIPVYFWHLCHTLIQQTERTNSMIKGVSKQVLEVTNPENPYFEKIVFFVKPQYAREDRAVLEREAHSLAARAGRPPRVRRSRREKWHFALRCLLSALAGVALSFLIYTLC